MHSKHKLSALAASVSAPIPVAASMPAPALVAEEVQRPRKKPKKKQEYMPGVGTANYAFIIVLYQVPSSTYIYVCCKAKN